MTYEAIFTYQGREFSLTITGTQLQVMQAAKRIGTRKGYTLVMVRHMSTLKRLLG